MFGPPPPLARPPLPQSSEPFPPPPLNIQNVYDKVTLPRLEGWLYGISSRKFPSSFSLTYSVPRLPEIANFNTQIVILSKACRGQGDINWLYHGLSTCTGDQALAKSLRIISSYRRTNHGITTTNADNST